jgi:heat shock protein HslJ
MACTESMDTEQSLLKVFKMTDHYAINGDTLVLSKTRMAPLARFVAIDKK